MTLKKLLPKNLRKTTRLPLKNPAVVKQRMSLHRNPADAQLKTLPQQILMKKPLKPETGARSTVRC